jgi:putative nucleotide binding protein
MAREEYAIVLDFLPYGFPLENRRMPLAIAIGETEFTLLMLVPRRGEKFDTGERVYIGEGKRDKVQYILGRCPREKLTDAAKMNLGDFVEKGVMKDEERFVKFFNKAQAINTRLHQFELLPGLGKKHTMAILAAREENDFESFEDIKNRVANMPAPEKVIAKRIMEELTERQRHNLFIA